MTSIKISLQSKSQHWSYLSLCMPKCVFLWLFFVCWVTDRKTDILTNIVKLLLQWYTSFSFFVCLTSFLKTNISFLYMENLQIEWLRPGSLRVGSSAHGFNEAVDFQQTHLDVDLHFESQTFNILLSPWYNPKALRRYLGVLMPYNEPNFS